MDLSLYIFVGGKHILVAISGMADKFLMPYKQYIFGGDLLVKYYVYSFVFFFTIKNPIEMPVYFF